MSEITLWLPTSVAVELVSDGVARETAQTRSVDVVSVLTMVADITSAATAVVVARGSIAAVVRRLLGHVEKDESSGLSIVVSSAAQGEIIVEVNDPKGFKSIQFRVQTAIERALDTTSDA
jgi:hypothetical protein